MEAIIKENNVKLDDELMEKHKDSYFIIEITDLGVDYSLENLIEQGIYSERINVSSEWIVDCWNNFFDFMMF